MVVCVVVVCVWCACVVWVMVWVVVVWVMVWVEVCVGVCGDVGDGVGDGVGAGVSPCQTMTWVQPQAKSISLSTQYCKLSLGYIYHATIICI